jgi:NADH dehydrogenase
VYQVATGALSPGEIAAPLRSIFKRDESVRVVLGEVTGFDLAARHVRSPDSRMAGRRDRFRTTA